MIEKNEYTRENEQWIGKFHEREAAQIASVDQVRDDAEEAKRDRKSVEDHEQDLSRNDAIYQTAKKSTGEYGVFFDELR